LIEAFDLDHTAQIWKEFDLTKCDFNREEIGLKNRIKDLEAELLNCHEELGWLHEELERSQSHY
jgi:hypothetical protein